MRKSVLFAAVTGIVVLLVLSKRAVGARRDSDDPESDRRGSDGSESDADGET